MNLVRIETVSIPLGKGLNLILNKEDWLHIRAIMSNKSSFRRLLGVNKYYAEFTDLNGNKHLVHRFILGQAKKSLDCDHINNNGLDNRRANLRYITHQLNIIRSKVKSKLKTTSKYKGVWWDKERSKWQAKVGKVHLGRFNNEIDAANAYDKKAKELYGNFAPLNLC